MTGFFNHLSNDKVFRLFTTLVILFWTLKFSSVSLEVKCAFQNWMARCAVGVPPLLTHVLGLALLADGTHVSSAQSEGRHLLRLCRIWGCAVLEALFQAARRTELEGDGVSLKTSKLPSADEPNRCYF